MGKVSVRLEKQANDFHFRGFNADGHSVDIDDATAYEDGKGNGVGPMQLIVIAIGACSGGDIVSILKKGRQELTAFVIEVDGYKPDGVSPSTYQHIVMNFRFEGRLDENKTRRAIDLGLGKYCSVAEMLSKSAQIEYRFSINGEEHAGSVLDFGA